MKIFKFVRQFLNDKSGTTAIEYGLIIALIFLVIISAVSLFATSATEKMKVASDAIAGVN